MWKVLIMLNLKTVALLEPYASGSIAFFLIVAAGVTKVHDAF